jgi:hypothetical protein
MGKVTMSRRRWMLTERNAPFSGVWRWLNAGLSIVAVSMSATHARSVEEDLAREAYVVAQNWVDRGHVPQATVSILMTQVSAVHATLRLRGATVGQSTAEAPEFLPGGPAADVMPLVLSAVGRAMEDAAATLSSRGSAAGPRAGLALDLQFAGPLEPVRLERLAELPGRIVLNAQGLAMQDGGRRAWSFPGNGTAANLQLDGHLNRLIAELNLPLDRKPGVGSNDGPPLFRFEVVHITTPVNATEPVTLYRGNELLAAEPLDDQRLALIGEQLADYLTHRQRKDGRFAGTYEPTPDQYRPETADAIGSAAAVYALARAARLSTVSQPERQRAARLGLETLVTSIGTPDASGRQVIGRDLEATAMAVLALLEAPGGSEFREARDRLVGALAAMQSKEGSFRSSVDPKARPVSAGAQALGAAAMVRAFDASRDPKLLERSRAALRALKLPDEGDEHRLLPWLAIAATELQRLDRPWDQHAVLGEICGRMLGRQVRPWAVEESAGSFSPDTVGGFLVGARLLPEPTHDSAWVLAGLAVAMRDPQTVEPGQRARWLVNSGLAARFVAQLTFQPSSAYYTRNPNEAIGGARVALYDNRQPLEATAAALLGVTELRHALRELAQPAP